MSSSLALSHYRTMARYNAWINERLYTAAAKVPDSERKADRGAFFGSIHGTLNHILLADLIWLQRFATADWDFPALEGLSFEPVMAITGLDMQLHDDFAALTDERQVVDAAILDWADTDLTEAVLADDLNYFNILRQRQTTLDMGLCVTHFFNHQTHHRGQVTTLLSQLNIDPGLTDMIAMPQDG